MRLYYGELVQKYVKKIGGTFDNRHDVLKGYTSRDLYFF
jgi:hypothetical protein